MNAIEDKSVTDLAREIYDGFRNWDERTTGRKLRPFSRINAAEKEPFKKLAEVLAKKRKREEQIRG